MRVLIIKTSSMGDIIHTLPALTDAGAVFPSIRFDWVVEENFIEIPHWHPLVENVIPVAIRRWRKNLFSRKTYHEFFNFYRMLRSTQYDAIIDAQGLLKSLWIAWLAKGKLRAGFDSSSARESCVSWFYQRKCNASWDLHAVNRLRRLFNQALNYPLPDSFVNYGIDRTALAGDNSQQHYIVFLHGTTWINKHWPEEYWCRLAKIANQNGYTVKLPWNNSAEYQRAERIAANCNQVELLPRLGLSEMANVLACAKAIISLDTGLGHLAAALNVPTVSLYGPTDPGKTGTAGLSQVHLSAKYPCAPCMSRECIFREDALQTIKPPCFTTVTPENVWTAVAGLI